MSIFQAKKLETKEIMTLYSALKPFPMLKYIPTQEDTIWWIIEFLEKL